MLFPLFFFLELWELINGKKNVWFPPNGKFQEGLFGVGTLISSIFRSASDRQKELDPTMTKVSFDGGVYLKKSEISSVKFFY
jgi:hypothetical protein